MAPKVAAAPFLLFLLAAGVVAVVSAVQPAPPAPGGKVVSPPLAPRPAAGGKVVSPALAPRPAAGGKVVSPAIAPGPVAPPANVTKILSRYPEFSSFSALLAETGLARAVAARPVVTILALNNTAVTAGAIRRLPRPFLADLLALHVVLDYLDPERLDALRRGRTGNGSVVATMLKGTGERFLRVAGGEDGRITFSYAGPGGGGRRNATLVRVVTSQAYRVLVLEVSGLVLPAAVPSIVAAPIDINVIFSRYPEFSVFSSLLTQTGLARAINTSPVVTVLAVNNTAVSRDLNGAPRQLVADRLALHVVLDFLDPEKLDALRSGRTGNGSMVKTLGAGFIRVSGGSDGRITFSSAAPGSSTPQNATLLRVVTAQANTVMVLEVTGLVAPPGIPKPPGRHMSLRPSTAPAPAPRYPPAAGPGLLAPSPMLPVPTAANLTATPPAAAGIIPIPSVHGGVAAKVASSAAGDMAASWPARAAVAVPIIASLIMLMSLH